MFDIGFAELVLISVIGLLVIGPEQLPGAIRTVSAWVNKIRRSYNDIRLEVQQELHNESILKDLRDTGERIKSESGEIKSKLEEEYNELGKQLYELPATRVQNTDTSSRKDDS